jgi:site-specific DNA-methyltransferase (adenine-specific)
MCEYAWTSFKDNAKVFKCSSARGADSGKFHPTEKPIELYKWLLTNYAEAGDKILDTHVGSASSLIACYDLGFDAVGYEIDKTYYEQAKRRLEDHQKQISIFDILD